MLERIDMQGFVNNLLEKNIRKEEKKMEKEQKKSYICYVYGQIYAAYLQGNKEQYTMVKNTQAQTWKLILNWLKANNHIADYQLGDTPQTAGEVIIKGFNEDKMIYKKYCEGVRENLEKAMQEVV